MKNVKMIVAGLLLASQVLAQPPAVITPDSILAQIKKNSVFLQPGGTLELARGRTVVAVNAYFAYQAKLTMISQLNVEIKNLSDALANEQAAIGFYEQIATKTDSQNATWTNAIAAKTDIETQITAKRAELSALF